MSLGHDGLEHGQADRKEFLRNVGLPAWFGAGRERGRDTFFRHFPIRFGERDSGWACRRTLTTDVDSASEHSGAEGGLVLALPGFHPVHIAHVALFSGQFDLGDVAPGWRPLAGYLLFAGNIARGDRAVIQCS